MVKLYKHLNEKTLYWETWNVKGADKAIIHWGIIGESGEHIEIESTSLQSLTVQIEKEIDTKRLEGYEEIDIDNQITLLIEYKTDETFIVENLEKRHQLEDVMDELLGWTGLGHCDGGSIGSGTMEVCCYVIDFEIAKRVIEESLKKTEFADYTRIYDENE